jgi:hypothetical protein
MDVTPEEGFKMVDVDGSGDVDAHEGFNALYCLAEWGHLSQEEAEFMWHYLGEHADHNPDGNPEALDFGEVEYALKNLEDMMKGEEGEGKRPMPFDHEPDCPPKPETEPQSIEEAFNMIDTDGSKKLSAKEGFEALYCLVKWEELSEEEAFAIYDHIGSHAGDDDEVELGEFEAAIGEMMEMSEEDIAAAIEAAN